MSSTSLTPISGEDLAGILADNGGVGEFETETEAGIVDRWMFPRFEGAEDDADMYLSRTGLGQYDTDVETVCGWMAAPRNRVGGVWVDGEPGGGKTGLVEAAAVHASTPDWKVILTTLLCTPDHTKDSLLLRFVGEGHGENGTPFVKGPLAHAAQYGHWFYADEFPLLVDGIKPIFYSLADGRRFLPEGNVDGSPLEIHPNFRLIMSGNMMVRGASLPEPLGSRVAGTSITVETDGSLLRDLGVDESIVQAWEGLVSGNLWHPQVREVRAADYWLKPGINADGTTREGDPTQAVSAFLPPHCPESQRKQIRDMVMGFLGGDLREDGRLVVR